MSKNNKNLSKKTSGKKKPINKKKAKKKAIKKKITKKTPKKKKVAQKKSIKKLSKKQLTFKKKKAKQSNKKKVSSQTAKSKTLSKKQKSNKVSLKKTLIRKTRDKQTTLPKKQKKAKTFVSSLSHREKELKKLLDKEKEEKLILKDMEGRTYCIIDDCDYPALVEDHCRIHFFGLFKMIKRKKQILEQDILTKNYRLLANKHSEVVFDYLFKDLSSDKSLNLAMKKFDDEETDDLENDETFSD